MIDTTTVLQSLSWKLTRVKANLSIDKLSPNLITNTTLCSNSPISFYILNEISTLPLEEEKKSSVPVNAYSTCWHACIYQVVCVLQPQVSFVYKQLGINNQMRMLSSCILQSDNSKELKKLGRTFAILFLEQHQTKIGRRCNTSRQIG